MEQISRSVHINAGPDEVISYVANPANHPAFIGPLKSVSNVGGDPTHLGTRWDWTFVWAGVQLEGSAETTEYQAGSAFGFTTRGIESTFSYRVDPENGGSRLTAAISYDVPDSVFAKVANRAVAVAFNERETDNAALALQAILGN